jgi:glycosyltransferase involved in cell wall biosynthesis
MSPAAPIVRVLYFTLVPLMGTGNGGSLCCRNHVIRLASDPGVELFALVIGPEPRRAGTAAFFAELGVPHHFETYHEYLPQAPAMGLRAIADFAVKMVFQYPWEVRALGQQHIAQSLSSQIAQHGIDVVVIDYLPSALFVELPRRDVGTALIGLNREAEFYGDMLRLGLSHHGPLTSRISHFRFKERDRRLQRSVDKFIAISPRDLPQGELPSPPTYITPYLDPQADAWRYRATKQAFFVGDVNHWPNGMAVRWIVQRLAPALRELGSDIRISVVGANPGEIPGSDACPNVEFLGRADATTLASLFQTANVMLCPIENDYGVKFKALEALAYGTPLFASKQTLLGLPHLSDLPAIDLDAPEQAALTLKSLIDSQEKLDAIHRLMWERQQAFIESQAGVWSKVLSGLAPSRRPPRG